MSVSAWTHRSPLPVTATKSSVSYACLFINGTSQFSDHIPQFKTRYVAPRKNGVHSSKRSPFSVVITEASATNCASAFRRVISLHILHSSLRTSQAKRDLQINGRNVAATWKRTGIALLRCTRQTDLLHWDSCLSCLTETYQRHTPDHGSYALSQNCNVY